MSSPIPNVDDFANAFESESDIQKLLQLVKMAELTKQHQDMRTFMKKLVELKSNRGEGLDVDERNLFLCAYKNVTADKRASWRTLSYDTLNEMDKDTMEKYKAVVADELQSICFEALDLLRNNLYKNVAGQNDEIEVFYLKMCGDYFRYLSEIRQENQYKTSAQEYYTKAMEIANTYLSSTHPTRLGLALNFSVHLYENLREPEKACDLARKTFDEAIEKLDTLRDDELYKGVVLIMQLIRDNLTLWTSDDLQ